MKYVDAGYFICLSVLFVYSIGIVLRRRKLLESVEAVDDAELLIARSGDNALVSASEPGATSTGATSTGATSTREKTRDETPGQSQANRRGGTGLLQES